MNSSTDPSYIQIMKHYESCFAKEGDSHKGVDWPNLNDANLRYKIMSELFKGRENIKLLDVGCGLGHYLNYLNTHHTSQDIQYTGLDISSVFIDHCQKKYPNSKFIQHDLLIKPLPFHVDFAVMNGVFTIKNSLTHQAMFNFLKEMLHVIYSSCNIGMAFNLMSKNVDWEREDLFHVSIDELTAFLSKELSRHIVIRHDYGLYEYTVYVYKKPLGGI
ncbi:class I SAM-dependent methyltransferase [Rheinheimera aquimaris]|jgi:SAM-dependent methyltransferase|uniref:class I SAM-dependent methyltransferase n=1 Tax=Rheinheimera aquimaris TaxID=412437 RepID=UPI0010671966|nr:class I SAM-dependent methyltransferase [Rheinheimera aquimaris]|tara:strand:+ start:3582 stop:4232 length:651 start_codon:yes stop_codon:yes gene_type:complete